MRTALDGSVLLQGQGDVTLEDAVSVLAHAFVVGNFIVVFARNITVMMLML